MFLGRALLVINSVAFALYGLGYLLFPAALSLIFTATSPENSLALIDMRATYGGGALGLAIIFALCARRGAYLRLGVQGLVAVVATQALSRSYGIFIEGAVNHFMLSFLATEILVAVLGLVALLRLPAK